MEKDLNSVIRAVLKSCKVQSVHEIDHTLLMKPSCCSKDTLAGFVERLLKLSSANIELCKSAGGQIDRLKTEKMEVQQTVIELQQKQLQKVQETVKSSVHDSVKTEISLWSEIVQKNSKPAPAPSVKTVQKAVRSVFDENVRSNNFIIYGVEEWEPDEEDEDEGDEEDVSSVASQLFNELKVFPKPAVLNATRIGTAKPKDETKEARPSCRPIKVILESAEEVKFVLSRAKMLKQNPCEHWKCVYLSPDRSREERAAHKKLVEQLKQKISNDSTKYHFIRDGQIKSTDKVISSA